MRNLKQKYLLILIAVLILVSVFAAGADPVLSVAMPHYMLGEVRKQVYFDVNLSEASVPFDLDNPEMSYNANWETVGIGFKIGTYSLLANVTTVEIRVSHTALVNRDPSVTEHNMINYRLYMRTGESFVSTTGEQVTISGLSVAENGVLRLNNNNIYITLEEEGGETATRAALETLSPGLYESTITFSIWGEL